VGKAHRVFANVLQFLGQGQIEVDAAFRLFTVVLQLGAQQREMVVLSRLRLELRQGPVAEKLGRRHPECLQMHRFGFLGLVAEVEHASQIE